MYILYSNTTAPTGRQIRDALGIGGSTRDPGDRQDHLIRWGSTTRVQYRARNVMNSANAIGRATNKLGSLEIMREHHVTTPDVFLRDVSPNRIPADMFPLLGRRTNHTQGRDIVLCMQREDVARAVEHGLSDYFTRYIPTSREFRVHVFRGEVIKISEKVLTNVQEFRLPWVRNFENGYTFRNPRDMTNVLSNTLSTQATGAVESLGLTFGAVDIVVGDDATAYVLEVNTGPSLGDNSLAVYVRKFAEEMGIPAANINLPQDEDNAEELDALAR